MADVVVVGDMRSVMTFRQRLCALTGHDAVLHFETGHVMLRCTSCGFDTPGWETGGRGPRQTYAGDPRRHELLRLRMVVRKTA
jgi:hypothetical protein